VSSVEPTDVRDHDRGSRGPICIAQSSIPSLEHSRIKSTLTLDFIGSTLIFKESSSEVGSDCTDLAVDAMTGYSDVLIDHFQSPRNRGQNFVANAAATASHGGSAPYVTVYLQIAEATIVRAGFESFGCGVAVAAASVLTEMISGKSIEACRIITAREVIDALEGVPLGKEFCADLAINALHLALDDQTVRSKGVPSCEHSNDGG
jgi:NifU-like protein involved in Fe-S cluster formation